MSQTLTATTPRLALTIRIIQVERTVKHLRLAREIHAKRPTAHNAAIVARWENALKELGGIEK